MSLETPSKIRDLQIKLYRKAKNEPDYRFYMLYDKIYREDILAHAYHWREPTKGAPGVDGLNFEEIELRGLEEWLNGIRQELCDKTYQPQPVRRVMIPKPGGGERPLGIPTIRDRVVQTAAKLVLEPIFEADLEPSAYGYRPKRSAQDAIRKVHKLVREGYTDVVDADLSKYFDTDSALRTDAVCRSANRRSGCAASDQDVAEGSGRGTGRKREAPVDGREGSTLRHSAGRGGQPDARQPVHEPFVEGLEEHQTGEQFQAQIVNYADDFVILSRGQAKEALEWTRQVVTRLGLTLNEAKTSIREARQESFDFLGYTFGPHRHRKTGHRYLGASPSKKSVRGSRPRWETCS
jgi:RNA-directed DNA polymerase